VVNTTRFYDSLMLRKRFFFTGFEPLAYEKTASTPRRGLHMHAAELSFMLQNTQLRNVNDSPTLHKNFFSQSHPVLPFVQYSLNILNHITYRA